MKIRVERYYFDKSILNKVLDVLSMKLVPTRGQSSFNTTSRGLDPISQGYLHYI